MQRGKYDTVTDIPILVPATLEQNDGVATFEREIPSPRSVRIFRVSDLGNPAKHLTELEARHFTAVVELAEALRKPSDSLALRRAWDSVEAVYELKRKQPSDPLWLDEDFLKKLSESLGMPRHEAVEVLEDKRAGPRAAKDLRWLLSYEVSEALNVSSRLVLWWTGDRLTPAIWCNDVKAAFYVRALLATVGGKGFRVCPHCSKAFFQQRADQHYCSVAHREAHRVARWRAAKVAKSRKRGRKNGTRKAR